MRSDLIRLIGHGAPGQFLMDETRVDLDALGNASVLEALKRKVDGADTVELLSCRVAFGEAGRHFIRELARLLGVRVFASSNFVGPENLGGTYFLDYGYNPHDDRELAGYQAQPVPNLTFLLPQPERYVSVTFTHGYIGTQANQQQPQDIYLFGPNLTGSDAAISSISFRQEDSDGNLLFDEGGFQGNDVVGELVVKFSGAYGENGETEAVFPGFLNFRETPGGKLQVFGFIAYDAPYTQADNPTNPDQPWIEAADMIDAGGWYSYIDDGTPNYTEPTGYNGSPGYTFTGVSSWTGDGTFPNDDSGAGTYTIFSGGVNDQSSNFGLVLENKNTSSTWEWNNSSVPTQNDDRNSDTNAALKGLLDALNSYLQAIGPISISNPTFVEVDPDPDTGDPGTLCELSYTVTLPETATASGPQTYEFSIEPGANVTGTDWVPANTTFENLLDVDGNPIAGTVLDNGDGTITVSQGVTTFDICLDVLADEDPEQTETIIVNVGAVSGTGTIYDDDNTISIDNVSVNESSDYAIFCVEWATDGGANVSNLNLSVTGPNPADLDTSGLDNATVEVWDDVARAWVTLDGTIPDSSFPTTGTDGRHKAFVRVSIGPEQEAALDNGEQFTITVEADGASALGTGTIFDDGTGDLFEGGIADPTDGPFIYDWDDVAQNYDPQLDDDRIITVDSPCANEQSPYIVFTVVGSAFQYTTLALASVGSAEIGAGASDDIRDALEVWDPVGGSWVSYTPASFLQFDSSGRILARTAINNADGNGAEGAETFELRASNTGQETFSGTGTIADNDACRTIFPDQDPAGLPLTPVTSSLLTIDDVTVNEASDYALFCVEFDAVLGTELTDLQIVDTAGNTGGNTLIPPQPEIQVWDEQAGAWVTYDTITNNAFSNQQFTGSGVSAGDPIKVFVRVNITAEQDEPYEVSENYALSVTYGSTVQGLLTIEDDGTEDIFDNSNSDPATTPIAFDWTGANFDPELDDDRPLTVSDSCASELSPYNAFTITGAPNQFARLEVVSGTPPGEATAGVDFGTAIEYWNGTQWLPLGVWGGENYIQLDANGHGLVRHAVNLDANDEGVESYLMRAYNTGDSLFEGTGEISDNGACVTLFPDVPAILDPLTGNPVAVEGELEINDIIVNEASDYAISQICGVSDMGGQNSDFAGIFIPEMVIAPDPSRPPEAITDYNLEYWDGNSWQSASGGFGLANDGCLYLRTTISEEQDEPYEISEAYNLVVPGMTSGRVTIVDGGTGVIYPGSLTGDTPTTSNRNLDDDAPPFEGMLDCSWDVEFSGLGGSYAGLAEHAFLDTHLGVLENAFGNYDLVVL